VNLEGGMENMERTVRNILEFLTTSRGARAMSTKRAWVWTGRLAALVAAVVIPACGTNGGTGMNSPNGIFWNTQSTGAPAQGGTGAGGQLWIDPNTGLGASPIGIQNIVTSVDDAVYGAWNPTAQAGVPSTSGTVKYIDAKWPESQHQLSTDTGSSTITARESTLEGQLNGYRQQQLGNVGGGGINGGLVVGNTTGIILPSHFIGTKMARGHCKHYAKNHQTGFSGGTNPEGDAMLDTDGITNGNPLNTFNWPVTDLVNHKGCAFGIGTTNTNDEVNPNGGTGRLGKLGVIAFNANKGFAGNVLLNDSIGLAGMNLGEPAAAYALLITNYPFEIGSVGWTNMAVGHWRGGFQGFYWNIIFLYNPIPPN